MAPSFLVLGALGERESSRAVSSMRKTMAKKCGIQLLLYIKLGCFG